MGRSAFRRRSGRWRALCSMLLAVGGLACASGRNSEPALVSIGLTPVSPELPKGLTIRLTAMGRYDDGTTRDLSAGAIWASSDPSIATVDAVGVVTAAAVGTVTVSAAVDGVVGQTGVSVLPAVPASLLVSPTGATLPKGLAQQFTVTGTLMSDGSVTAAPASWTWTCSDSTVASIDGAGVASAKAIGTATITATAVDLTGTASMTVDRPALVSVSLPSQLTIVRGLARPLRALGTFTDGSMEDATSTLTWTSSDGAVATVSAQGSVRGMAPGVATITGAQGTISASVQCTVRGQRLVFVTSESGPGNLASWQSASGKTGLAAADAVCNAAAASAGLLGTFKAWLSDANDDAYCRIHRALGKRIENCGAETLPDDAGPWIRTDGFPFAASASDLMAGKVLVPVRYDERGRESSGESWYFTATGLTGALFTTEASTCAEWTTSGGSSVSWVGSSDGATWWWTIAGTADCNSPHRLLCFEVGAGQGPAIPSYAVTGKKAFVTSINGAGDLSAWPGAAGHSGLAAGDAICAARAAAAGLSGTFKAWLADSMTSAVSRFTGEGPWVRLDGVLVASSRLELTSGRLRTTLGVDEFGQYVGHEGAYTGASPSGAASSPNCSDWTDASFSAQGVGGTVATAGRAWTWFGPATCAGYARLYCFEQ